MFVLTNLGHEFTNQQMYQFSVLHIPLYAAHLLDIYDTGLGFCAARDTPLKLQGVGLMTKTPDPFRWAGGLSWCRTVFVPGLLWHVRSVTFLLRFRERYNLRPIRLSLEVLRETGVIRLELHHCFSVDHLHDCPVHRRCR